MKRRIPSFRPLAPSINHQSNGKYEAANTPTQDTVQEAIEACKKAFSQATNWGVETDPSSDSIALRLVDNLVTDLGTDTSDLVSDRTLAEIPSVSMDRAAGLLQAIENLASKLQATESALREREGELAATLALSNHAAPNKELGARLGSILESTSKSIGAVASGLYLLNERTTELKLRAAFGLPTSRLIQPPRDLRSSLADLEALLGNAVLLTDLNAAPDWKSPEPYRSALVVPIGTTSMPHGTVWFWSDGIRSYSTAEIEVANLAAGRLMGEIEQVILGKEVTQARFMTRQLDAAAESQASMLPDLQILHEDYDIGGWSQQQSRLGGALHHWDLTQDGRLAFLVGAARSNHALGCTVATSVATIFRVLHERGVSLRDNMQTINQRHWSHGHPGWHIDLSAIQIHPPTGNAIACSAGEQYCLIVNAQGIRHVGSFLPSVGKNPDQMYQPGRFQLASGEMLVAFPARILPSAPKGISRGFASDAPSESAALDLPRLLKFLRDWREEPAQDLANSIAEQLPVLDELGSDPADRSLLIIKRIAG